MFENAKWITAPEATGGFYGAENGSFLLTKQINVPTKFVKAVLNISMLGYGEVTVNGKRITDEVLSTPFTKFDSTVLYNVYDVTDILDNKNMLGVFIGNGLYNDNASTWLFDKATWRHHPKMIAQLDITLDSGAVMTIVSDTSWKGHTGPCIYNHSREGETYDARLEIKGWNTCDCDFSEWKNAVICASPGGILKPVKMPPARVIKTLKPVSVKDNLYDFGEGISGWVRITARGDAGTAIKCEYFDTVFEDGTPDPRMNVFLERTGSQHINYDEYIMKGEGVETYAPKFCYHGFRYVRVSGAPESFEIVAEVVHTDLKTIGSFECSDEMLNKIHDASVRSTLTNYLSVPTDCPHREQNGWTGDAFLSCQQALLNFDMTSSYEKWMGDFQDVQRPSGQLPGIIPTSAWGYNWGNGPAWDGAMFGIPWYVYQNTGNTGLIYKMWDNMKLYMDYIHSMSENYIVDYGLGDWLRPKDTFYCPTAVTGTALYYFFARVMAKCAKIVGEDASRYEVLAINVKNAFREKFFGNEELEKNQTYLACIIYQGLCEEQELPKYSKMLNDAIVSADYHTTAGILGIKYVFSALSENGYGETLYKMVTNPTYPSYAYWINKGYNTLFEDWEGECSCNHHMFSEVDHWFYRHLAGIHLDENGLVIKPLFIVDWVKAKHRSIEVSWDKNEVRVFTPIEAKLDMDGKIYDLKVGENIIKRN